ncbi:MAG TPA: DUF790 family protein [Candidatus Competibacteraceae bacterium]|nr:DUF790 family protein [Candidatus Competibacteraceae bacterium]
MLPAELLASHRRGDQVHPRFLQPGEQPWATAVLELLAEYRGRSRGELTEALRALEGDSPDYRIVRGLAHLALQRAEFALALPGLEPEALRERVFTRAAECGHGMAQSHAVLEQVAAELGLELEPEQLRQALYADLPEQHVLAAVSEDTPQALIDRYNLAQAQGLLYSALYLRLTAYRNVPGEYRRLFHRLKFHGLMYAVEGDLEDGYQIHVDGPASLFGQTRRYGLQMAAFLPALLHLSRWKLEAVLLDRQGRERIFRLDSDSHRLRSHYPAPAPYDSLLEASFAERWAKLDTPWVLEREVALIDLKGTVFVPDFALRHSDGRVAYIEIMGFWHPDYIRRKLDKICRADLPNLILAVSDRLNVGQAALAELPGPVVLFKGKLLRGQILPLLPA